MSYESSNRSRLVAVRNTEEGEFVQSILNKPFKVEPDKSKHSHYLGALFRREFEKTALALHPYSKFADIGASRRHLDSEYKHVFTNRPIMCTADKARQEACESTLRRLALRDPIDGPTYRANLYCAHPQEGVLCACMVRFDPEYLLSIDTSYYPGVTQTIIDSLAKNARGLGSNVKAAYVAGHIFENDLLTEQRFGFNDNEEGVWSYDKTKYTCWFTKTSKTHVTMKVNGNSFEYKHQLLEFNDQLLINDAFSIQMGVNVDTGAVDQNGAPIIASRIETVVFTVLKRVKSYASQYVLYRMEIAPIIDQVIFQSAIYKPLTIEKEAVIDAVLDVPVVPVKAITEQPPNSVNIGDATVIFDINLLQNGKILKIVEKEKAYYFRAVEGVLQSGTILSSEYSKYIPESHFRELIPINKLNKLIADLLCEDNSFYQKDQFAQRMSKKLSVLCRTLSEGTNVLIVRALMIAALTQAYQLQVAILQVSDSPVVNRLRAITAPGVRFFTETCCQKFTKRLLWVMFFITLVFALYYGAVFISENYNFILEIIKSGQSTLTIDSVSHPRVKASTATQPIGFWFFFCLLLLLVYKLWWRLIHKGIAVIFNIEPSAAIVIPTSCICEDNYPEVCGKLDRDTKWNLRESHTLSLDSFLALKCDKETNGLIQIGPIVEEAPKPIIYHMCKATNYCAIKRQATEVTYCDPIVLNQFKIWFERIFLNEIAPLLDTFTYTYEDWFNHLTASQQSPLLGIEATEIPKDNGYEMFVKVEKQLYDNGMAPKNRCICTPNVFHKYVLGPVCYNLESLFKNGVKGYCGGKNWAEMEDIYNLCDTKNLAQTVQLDGSGFDRTQHYEIKKIVDHAIYKYIAPKIHHVDRETFEFYATPEYRKISLYENVKMGRYNYREPLGHILQRGKVFSGSMDTTLMNTLRMALYNRFVVETVMKINRDDYELICKGDDSCVFLPSNVSESKIRIAFNKIFSTKKTGIHGLGQIAKYLKIGDISDIDFCSTSTFYSAAAQGYKITRKIDRFLALTPWSRKALKMSFNEIKVLRQAIYVGNLAWMKGLPLFTEYNDNYQEDLTGISVYTKGGPQKRYEPGLSVDFDRYFTKDEYYSAKDRVSSKEASANDFAITLEQKFEKTNFSAFREIGCPYSTIRNSGVASLWEEALT